MRIRLAGTVAALLGWSALVVPALPDAPGVRTGANVAGVLVLLAVTRAGGYTWPELSLSAATSRRGLRWGAGALLTTGVVYGAAFVLPPLTGLLNSPDVAGRTRGEVALQALVLIPVGTVVCEELAFRGVLAAVADRTCSQPVALVVTAVVFGLWHLVPAWDGGPAEAFTAVAVTTLGGLVFGLLRQRTRSVLAPMGLHLGTNSLGLLAVALHQG